MKQIKPSATEIRISPLFRALLSFRLLTVFAMSLLPENQGGADKISRYVSRSDVEEAIGGLAVDISPGQIFRKKVSLPILLTYRLILSTESHSRERTNKVRSGQSRQLCYLTGRGSQVPAAQRISTAMQPLPASKVSDARGCGRLAWPAPPHLNATRAESRASSA